MSHFAVLVIGPDVERQLAPFHEFECTGTNDEHVQDIDKTEDRRDEYQASEDKEGKSFQQWLTENYGTPVVPFGESPDLSEKHKYGYAILDAKGEVEKVVKRTNPNKRWDWWSVGGRWSGLLKLRDGSKADSALKRDVDFAGMRDEVGEKAAKRYDAVAKAIAGRHFDTWPEARAKFPGDIEAARNFYWKQPVVIDTQKLDECRFDGPDEFRTPREDYIARARRCAGETFAVLKDEQWYERGKMGWWAMVSDEMDEGEWSRRFSELVDSLPDDAILTVVDCHI